jgi:predicted RNA-binding Zn-ribbon protein involved in translation (DUF1610 family)
VDPVSLISPIILGSDPITISIRTDTRVSASTHANEAGIMPVRLGLLVASSPFCVSVLYPCRAQSRSVENEMPQAYCVKCKTSIEIKNPQNVTLKNGKPAVKGVCPNCGTSVFRIGKA